MTRGKRMHQIATRADDALVDELAAYQREYERVKGPTTRALVVLELLERWARERREARARARVDRDAEAGKAG